MDMLGKYDLAIEVHVENNKELKEILDKFREIFINYYSNYDILTVNKEYVMRWSYFL